MKRFAKSVVAVAIAIATTLSIMPGALATTYGSKNGTTFIYDSSLSAAYNISSVWYGPLPRITYDCQGCDSILELDEDGETIDITLQNWDKYTADIDCYIFIYAVENLSSSIATAVQDVPIKYITPIGTFDEYTDSNGRATLNIDRSEIDAVIPKETPTPTPTPTPTSTPTPTPTPTTTSTATKAPTTITPPPTKTTVPTKSPTPIKTPTATTAPSPTKTPVVTTTPSTTTTPSPTKTPTATTTPKPTKTPTATTTPKPTKTPVATEEPIVKKTPKPTKTPIATEKPQRTAKPQTTETPKITEPPEKSIFKDVSVSHWAYDNIKKITELGAFSGYVDGTFHPDNQITHEEFLKVVMSLIYNDEFDAMPENYVYLADNDTSSSNYWTNRWAAWAQPYLTAAIDIGIVTADDIDLGATETPITRGEMAKIISRAVEYLGENEASNGSEVSSSISDWKTIPSEYKNYIAQAYSKGILAGYNDGSFGSEKSLTRAEASAVVIRLIDKSERRK